MSSIKNRYEANKTLKVGDECKCPSCGTKFIKQAYNQSFCKSKPKTQCKDKYYNTVDPNKRNNVTRVSPSNAQYRGYLAVIRDAQRTKKVRFGVWHDDDWNEGSGGSGVSENEI